MLTTSSIRTAGELLAAPELGRCELVLGELVMMSPAGFEHGRIAGNVQYFLDAFVREHRLGIAPTAEAGYLIHEDPDTVRAPDVSFVRAQRVPTSSEGGYFRGAPDLAVEVLSPNDLASAVLTKVHDWLNAGCSAVWIIDPKPRTVTVYRSDAPPQKLDEAGTLVAEDILPGFRLQITDVFA